MKTKLLSFTVAVLATVNAWASTDRWQGAGAAYSPDGKLLESYLLEVTETHLAWNVVQTDTVVTKADGQKRLLSNKLTFNGARWKNESSLGTGGGTCYGARVCENYIEGDDGLAYATTIFNESPDARTNVTFVLKEGKTIRVLRDGVTRLR